MSSYYDGELPADKASVVRLHIELCPRCAAELQSFQQLSRLASALPTPTASDSWTDLQRQLRETAAGGPKKPSRSESARRPRQWLLASTLLGGIAVLLLAFWLAHRDSHSGGDFDAFLTEFKKSPEVADRILAERYNGQHVTTAEAETLLRYRPTIARGVPAGYSLESLYVVRMPCCTCLQANLRREESGRIVLFEHNSLEPEWFDDRPTITAISQGGPTRLTQIDGALAASCPHEQRRLTLVGAQDLAEVDRLLEFWTQGPVASPR